MKLSKQLVFIHGYDSNGEPVVVEAYGDEIISFEDGEIVVPTKYLNKKWSQVNYKIKSQCGIYLIIGDKGVKKAQKYI